MRKVLSDVATVVMAICAVAVTALAVTRTLHSAPGTPEPPRPRTIDHWRDLARDGHIVGDSAAPVVVIAFSDFQCPFCAAIEPTIDTLLQSDGRKLAVVRHHFPLESIHKYARPAAEAAECAGEQGRYEAYHHVLFAHQASFGTISWDSLATLAEVPSKAKFHDCIVTHRYAQRIDADAGTADKLGLQGTPSFIINGVLYPGGTTPAMLKERVAAALRDAR